MEAPAFSSKLRSNCFNPSSVAPTHRNLIQWCEKCAISAAVMTAEHTVSTFSDSCCLRYMTNPSIKDCHTRSFHYRISDIYARYLNDADNTAFFQNGFILFTNGGLLFLHICFFITVILQCLLKLIYELIRLLLSGCTPEKRGCRTK